MDGDLPNLKDLRSTNENDDIVTMRFFFFLPPLFSSWMCFAYHKDHLHHYRNGILEEHDA